MAKKQIARYNCISFDVFDTLITRDCEHPADLFSFVEDQFNKGTSTDRCIGFAQKRRQAEASFYKDGILPTLDQIYDRMAFGKELSAELKKLEMDVEFAFCQRRPSAYDLYKYAKENGKRIIAISDMYLPADVIRKMLYKVGYEISEIYVSCEYGVDKTHGKLYEKALKEAGINKSDIVHFGDNILADILGAKIAGIHAVHMPKSNELYYFKKGNDAFANRFLRKFVANRCAMNDSQISKLGYEVFGPTIIGFCQWVHAQVQYARYDKVLFCARDMLQTYHIYKEMFPEDNERLTYLFVSRKSLELPYRAAAGKDCSDAAVEQLRLTQDYLAQSGCRGNIALVDSGFSGTSQKMLSVIMKGQCEVHGLYMRVNNTFYKNISDTASYAYLYSGRPNEGYYIGAAFFETMIAATHGRTIGYQQGVDGVVKPIFGNPNPNTTLLDAFQQGIRLFAIDFQYSVFIGQTINAAAVQDSYLNFCFYPKKNDVKNLCTVLGGDDTYSQIIINRKNRNYICHPDQFFHDLRSTSWKGGFLIRYTFPFSHILSWMYVLLGTLYLSLFGESRCLRLSDSPQKTET